MVSLVLFVACLAQQTVSVETLTQRAQECFKLGKYSEAREALQQALQQSPRQAGLWKYLGLVEAQLNHVDAAITDFEKALSLAPGDAQTHFDLGLLYRRKNDSTKALASYRQGLQLQASNAPGLQNYALLLMETGQFKDAIAPLKTLRKVSTDLSVRVALIECYLNSGENDEAQREIHALCRLRVENRRSNRNRSHRDPERSHRAGRPSAVSGQEGRSKPSGCNRCAQHRGGIETPTTLDQSGVA